MGTKLMKGIFKKGTVISAVFSALCATSALAAPDIQNFGYTVPFNKAGGSVIVADDVSLGGNIKRIMLRFTESQRNDGEQLVVSDAGTGLRSYVQQNILFIEGEGSAADYERVLRTLRYTSSTPPEQFQEQAIEIAVLDDAEVTVVSKRIIADPSGNYRINRSEVSESRVYPLTPEMRGEAISQPAPVQVAPVDVAEEDGEADNATGDMGIIEPTAQQMIVPTAPYEEAPVRAAGQPSGPLINAMVAAYHTNEQLMSKRMQLRVTDELASQAFSFWLPQFSINAQKGVTVTDRPDVRSNDVVEQYGAEFNMPLFRGGRTMARMNREDQRIHAERYDLLNTEQDILLEATTSFMSVWRDRTLLDLYRQNENVLKTNLEDTQARFRLGEVTQTDVFQSETRFTRAITERLRTERELRESEARYARFVGDTVPVAYAYNMPETAHFFEGEELNADNLIGSALQFHPLIKTAEHDLMAAREDIDLKKGQILPTISFNASVDRQDGGFIGGAADDSTTRSALLNIDVPLYQSGSEYSEVRQAKRTVEKLRHDLEDRRQAVEENVINSTQGVNVALRSIENNGRQAMAAEKALQSVVYESQLGTRTTLDALDAQQEFLEAKILLTRSQYEEAVGAYRLLASLGRLNSLSMKLPVDYFDPESHYNKVKRKIIGF